MINCPKCGAGNQVGTLFCRSCGDRLNLDEIRPPTEDEVRRAQGFDLWKWLRIARRAAVFALVIFFLYVIVGFFRQPAVTAIAVPAGAEKVAAEKKTDALFRVGLKPAVQPFSSSELTALADGMLGLPVQAENAGMALAPEHMEVEVLPSGLLRATLRCRLMGMTVYNTVIYKVETGDNGPSVRPVTALFGRIHLPGFAQSFVTGRLEALFANSPDLQYLKTHASAVSVDGGDGLLTLTLPAGIRDAAMRDELQRVIEVRAARKKTDAPK